MIKYRQPKFNPNAPLAAEGTITPTVLAPRLETLPEPPVMTPAAVTPPLNYDLNQASVMENERRAAMNPLQRAEDDYSEAVAAKPEKQGLGKQILFQALQMVGNLATGENRPVEFLGNAKRQAKIDQAARVLAPLQQQEDRKLRNEALQAQTEQRLDAPRLAREKMQQQVKLEMRRQQARMDVLNRQADIRSGEAKIFTDKDGKLWKQFLKPDSNGQLKADEPVINPITGEQEFSPGEQMIEVTDPTDSTRTIQVKAKQWLMPSATIANQNANRQQQADTTNANNEIRAASENANNLQKYNDQVLKLAMESSQANGTVIENQTELQAINDSTMAATAELGRLATQDTSAMDDEQIEKLNRRMQALTDQINGNHIKFGQALGKTKAGQEALSKISGMNIQKPQTIVAPKIKAVRVNSGRVVPKSKDPLGLFQ